MPLIKKQYPRGMAYSILGLAGYLKQFPDAEDVKSCMANAADLIVSRFEKNMKPDWPWFENILTYDNAMLPCALFTAGISLRDKKYIEIAKKICDFCSRKHFHRQSLSVSSAVRDGFRGEAKRHNSTSSQSRQRGQY